MTQLPGAGRQEQGPDCVIRVVRTSGTIRKSEEELIRKARGEVTRARRAQGEGESDVLAKLIGGTEHVAAAVGALHGTIEDDRLNSGSESEGG